MASGNSCFHFFYRPHDNEDWRCWYCGEPEPKLEGLK